MTSISYKTEKGSTRFRPILENKTELEENVGFCVGCGTITEGVEPDACKYSCETCQLPMVYGIEELVLMGIAKFEFNNTAAGS